jgi:hypothetical protein
MVGEEECPFQMEPGALVAVLALRIGTIRAPEAVQPVGVKALNTNVQFYGTRRLSELIRVNPT